eukprot:scaffold1019_cov255-Pinguiococcus_pyrenoidosus.AAC.20
MDETHLSEEQDEATDRGHCEDAGSVAEDQEEGPPGRRAEAVSEDGRLDVGVLVEESDALLQAPQAALADAEQVLGNLQASHDPVRLALVQDALW